MGWAVALHGGAGVPCSLPPEARQPREEALRHCLQIGVKALKSNMARLRHAPPSPSHLSHPLFDMANRVPIPANNSSLIAMIADEGVETIDTSHFITPENIERLNQAKEANRVQIDYTQPIQNDTTKSETETPFANGDSHLGTVGCVAVDSYGNLASATSTGGLVNKMVSQIGDTPLIGAGTYANELCAVSAIGIGEALIHGTVTRDVAAMMEFKSLSLEEGADCVVHERIPKGTVGLVVVSAVGEVAMPYNTPGMFRVCATEDGYSEVAICA